MDHFHDISYPAKVLNPPGRLKIPRAIHSQSWPAGIEPLVSICCITYKHENFIREAIESFLKQKTTFRVEILIHDDASSDKTPDILKKYEVAYPGLIRVVYQEENQFSRGIDPEQFLFPIAKGTYIALCEGDDYWTNPLKLQKQIEFFEGHPDFSACFGGYRRSVENTGETKEIICERNPSKYKYGFEFTLTGMQHSWLTKTLTAVFRTSVLKEIDLSVYSHRRDIHLFYHLIKNYKGFYFNDVFGVYRVHEGGINSMNHGKVNQNVSYRCYRELYVYNIDEFTRKMCLKHTLELLSFNIYHQYPGNSLSGNIHLLLEAIQLIKTLTEIKMLFALFLKREWKEKIKEIIRESKFQF